MPQPKNEMLRLLVPAVVVVVGIGVALAVLKSTKTSGTSTPTPAAATQPAPTSTTPAPAAATTPAPVPATQAPAPVAPAPQPGPATPASPTAATTTGFHVVPVTALVTSPPLGDLDPKGLYKAQVKFSTTGAGIESLAFADQFETIRDEKHVEVQQAHWMRRLSESDGTLSAAVTLVDGEAASAVVNGIVFPLSRVNVTADSVEFQADDGSVFKRLSIQSATPDVLVPFAALAVEITPPGGTPVIVALTGANVWQANPTKPGHFEAVIADEGGTPVLRLTREYTLAQGSLEIGLAQQAVNLSGGALSIKWYEAGPADLPQDAMGYGGDKRRVRFGYLLPPEKDPTRGQVLASEYLLPRAQVLAKREPLIGPDGKPLLDAAHQPLEAFKDKAEWPNERSKDKRYDLVWAGTTNRYFGVAAHPINDHGPNGKVFDWVETISRVVLDGGLGHEAMALRLESRAVMLAPAGKPGASTDFSHGIFAGPLDRDGIAKDPLFLSLGLPGLVVYNFGGPCSFCTFAPVSDLLLWILHTLHDKVFQDWSLSIILLVLIVRTCMHPVTKWSQVRMARFGKQMAGIAPKQKVLKEKYKDDPKKLQEETGKLWREEGISPAGFLGCLPMGLQTPVWIALYASLYFSVEMRNHPAFYGVFQHTLPKTSHFWQFLGNLAEPDRLLYWGKTIVTIPFVGWKWEPHLPLLGDITSLNILPLLLAVVFFLQQKYLTPPTTATMTPEQEFQQKMMRWMTVFMFPVFMYNAPSGLAIYFICNSTFAILESRHIRAHVAKLDAAKALKGPSGTGMIDRKDKKQGFMARLQEMAEQKQKEALKQARRTGKGPRK